MTRGVYRADALTEGEVGRLLGVTINGVAACADLEPTARIGTAAHRRYRLADVAAWAERHARGQPAPVRLDDLTRRRREYRPRPLARGMRHAERDARIRELRLSGWTLAAIGAEYGLTKAGVSGVIRRDPSRSG